MHEAGAGAGALPAAARPAARAALGARELWVAARSVLRDSIVDIWRVWGREKVRGKKSWGRIGRGTRREGKSLG